MYAQNILTEIFSLSKLSWHDKFGGLYYSGSQTDENP